MKIVRFIIYLILMITAVFTAFLLYCIVNPGVGKALSDRLNAKAGLKGSGYSSALSEDSAGSESENGAEGDFRGLAEGLSPAYEEGDEPLKVRSELRSKTGCEEVSADEIPVSEPEAEKLQKTLSPGNTGDDLTFDPLIYPYYDMLNDENKALYRQIYSNALDLNPAFLPIGTPYMKNLRTAFTAVINDHPELFWLNTAFSSMSAPSGACVEMDLSFNRTADDLDAASEKMENSAGQILNGVRNMTDDAEKEKYIHDVLIGSINYDRSAIMNQSAYSALVNGRTVCAGYSRAFQYLCQKLGIPAYYCAGNAGEPHAWNIIKLGDGFYNVDSTWDDTEGHEYDYFNRDDAFFNKDHRRRELSVYLPPCRGEEFSGPEPVPYGDEEDALEEPTGEEGSGEGNPGESDPGEGDSVGSDPGEENPQGDHMLKEAYENSLKTLEDYGFDEEDLLGDIKSYYEKAKKEILERGKGSYEFDCVIKGSDLKDEIRESNRTGEYKDAYMRDALNELKADSCLVKMQIEELRGENYLIRHSVDIK